VGGRHGWRRGTGTSTDGDRDGTDDRDARKPRDERRRGDEKANARERARAPSFPRAARRVESTRLVDAMIPIDGCVTMNGCESKNARGRRTSVVGAVHTFPVGRGTARCRRADARRRGSHLRFQARTRSIVRHHRWIYTGIARHRELRMPRRSHSFVFSLGRATVRLLVCATSPATATTRRETKSTPTARALVSSPARLAFTLAFASVHSNRRPVAANFSSLESPPRAQSPPRGDDDVPRRRREVDARAPTLDRAIATATTMGTTTRAFVQPRARRRRRREKTPRGRRRN